MKAYYIHRYHPNFGYFCQGQILDVIRDPETIIKYLHDKENVFRLEEYFPHGVTLHGLGFVSGCNRVNSNYESHLIEAFFEIVRRKEYPNMPSRFESIFAAPDESAAIRWGEILQSNYGPSSVWEIEYEIEAPCLDASFLSISDKKDFSFLKSLENCHRYWSGSKASSPLLELLITPPVCIVRKVRDL